MTTVGYIQHVAGVQELQVRRFYAFRSVEVDVRPYGVGSICTIGIQDVSALPEKSPSTPLLYRGQAARNVGCISLQREPGCKSAWKTVFIDVLF